MPRFLKGSFALLAISSQVFQNSYEFTFLQCSNATSVPTNFGMLPDERPAGRIPDPRDVEVEPVGADDFVNLADDLSGADENVNLSGAEFVNSAPQGDIENPEPRVANTITDPEDGLVEVSRFRGCLTRFRTGCLTRFRTGLTDPLKRYTMMSGIAVLAVASGVVAYELRRIITLLEEQ